MLTRRQAQLLEEQQPPAQANDAVAAVEAAPTAREQSHRSDAQPVASQGTSDTVMQASFESASGRPRRTAAAQLLSALFATPATTTTTTANTATTVAVGNREEHVGAFEAPPRRRRTLALSTHPLAQSSAQSAVLTTHAPSPATSARSTHRLSLRGAPHRQTKEPVSDEVRASTTVTPTAQPAARALAGGPTAAVPAANAQPSRRHRLSFHPVTADDAVFAHPSTHGGPSTSPHEAGEDDTSHISGSMLEPRGGSSRSGPSKASAAPRPLSHRLQLNVRAATRVRMQHSLWTAVMADEARRWHALSRTTLNDALIIDFEDDDGDEEVREGGIHDPPQSDRTPAPALRPAKPTPLFFPKQRPTPGRAPRMTADVTAAAAAQSWTGVVADLTEWTRERPASPVRTNDTPSTAGAAHSSENASTQTPLATGRVPTLRQLVETKRQALSEIQVFVADSVHRQYYLRLHEERMRQLLACAGDEGIPLHPAAVLGRGTAHAPPSAADTEGQSLDGLDDAHSERGTAVMDIISALDQQLQVQFASVYRLPLAPNQAAHASPPATTAPAGALSSAHPHAVKTERAEGSEAPRPAEAEDRTAPEDEKVKVTNEEDAWWSSLRLAALGEAVDEATQLIPAFRDVLMPYQREGVRWMLQLNAMEQLNGILADDMGLGKTAQTVMYLTSYKLLVESVVQRRLERLLHDAYKDAPLALALHLTTDGNDSVTSVKAESDAATGACSGDGGALTDAQREEMRQDRLRLQRLVREARLAKELKRWIWQLSEADVASHPVKRSHHSSMAASYASLADVSYPETNSPATLHMRKLLALPHCSPQLNALLELGESDDEDDDKGGDNHSGGASHHPTSVLTGASPSETASAPERLHEHMGRRCMRPILILAPLSTLPHWAAEFSHFNVDHLFSLYVLNGSRDERTQKAKHFLQHVRGEAPTELDSHKRKHRRRTAGPALSGFYNSAEAKAERARQRRLRSEREDADPFHFPHFGRTPVLLIAHDFLARPRQGNYLRQLPHVTFHTVIIDEAQRIKNKAAELFRRVCRLRSTSRFILTGTPLQNNIKELFALLQFVAPQSFHTRRQADLLDQLDEALGAASRTSTAEDAHLHMLLCRRVHRLLTPFILRRDKSVLKAVLPTKKDFLVVCPLLPRQEEDIAEVTAKAQAGTLGGHSHIQIQKILLHPYTRLPYFYVDDDITTTSGKVLVLDFMMSFLRATGHKFLVFCSWTLVLDVVESLCQHRALPYVRLDGNTTAEQREVNIQRFNASTNRGEDDDEEDGDDYGDGDVEDSPEAPASEDDDASVTEKASAPRRKRPRADSCVAHNGEARTTAAASPPSGEEPCCFLISKVAGGVGLNLQSADTVFLLDVDYNPQRDLQALSRVYRVGQKREVRIFRLITDHPVERNTLTIHKAKENLDQAVVQAGKFDLHSSSDDRQAELNKLFGLTAATPEGAAASPNSGVPVSAVGSPTTPHDWDTDPVSPNAPLGLHLPAAASRQHQAATTMAHTVSADTLGSSADNGAQGEGMVTRRRRRALDALIAQQQQPMTPTEHLAEMAEIFREILPRSDVESDVLEGMLHDLNRRRASRHADPSEP